MRPGLLALDVSNQNPVTVETVKQSGCGLLIAKATEGASFQDALYPQHRKAAHDAGVRFGSYLFLHSGTRQSEAAYYLDYAKPAPGDLVIIDAEGAGQDSTVAAMAKRVQRCALALEKAGHKPILYASADYWKQLVQEVPALKRLRVWEAQYPGKFQAWFPRLARLRARLSGANVVLWQWTDSYQVGNRKFDASRILINPDNL